ncbi:GtrA family protein [Bacteroides thetaiotaomicron]|uniref:GtrA family protein n=1 Tax=Bacteroides thetaiotaomicron TaxID=818 RepID=A0AAW4Z3K0_BACT4|nr:GtrA family protein [Bacteroides thetaiotaomicron]MCE9237309.1 GtrA family protein [Bacteroides thetaiotaomicron]MCE9266457.1 GtrA family protein [Bacteroides thetaiotaomicron]MCE9275995.1 GtrA family protein [Bacteroides thetaiotaomicron]MCE9289761.1 GtrA family protein [Bacteroides thetaiotaomicron]
MKESVRIFRFIVIGTMNALIMALVVWLMMREMSFEGDYMVANVTAYIIAQIHNFIWCKYWIFPVEKRKNNVWKQILFFCSAFGVAYTAQFLFLILLVEGLDVNEYLAQFFGLFIYGAANFIANKKITFQ